MTLDEPRLPLGAEALQDLGQDDVGERDGLTRLDQLDAALRLRSGGLKDGAVSSSICALVEDGGASGRARRLGITMTQAIIRLATHDDIEQLVEMRCDFTFEDFDQGAAVARPGYDDDCRTFLTDAITSGRWHIWVAEMDGGQVISHAFVALIDKVPRPIRENARIAYLTNVYTRPDFRGQGIGAQVIRAAQSAAREADVELIIVWPSDESAEFYKREGFAEPDEPLIWTTEPEAL